MDVGVGFHLSPAGRAWDAVSAERPVGLAAYEALGEASSAVLCDSTGQLLWLVPAGSTRGWAVPHTEVYGPCTYVVIPPASRTKGPGEHWLRPPGPHGYMTDPGRLRAALLAAIEQLTIRRAGFLTALKQLTIRRELADTAGEPPFIRCGDCQKLRADVRLVVIVEQATGPGGGLSACLECVPMGQGVLDEAAVS